MVTIGPYDETFFGVLSTDSRSGNYAWTSDDNTFYEYLIKDLPATYRLIIAGFAIKIGKFGATTSNDHGLLLHSGTLRGNDLLRQLTLTWDGSGYVKLYRGDSTTGTLLGTGTTQMSELSWYYIELRAYIDSASGEYEVRIDGTTEISGTSANTQGTSDNYISSITQAFPDFTTSYASDSLMDDIYVRGDETTNTAGGFLGPVKIYGLVPNANGTLRDLTPSTGTDDYAVIDELPPSMTDYLYSSTDGDQVTVHVEDMPVLGTIMAVTAHYYATVEDGTGRNFIPLCRSNGTVYSGATQRVKERTYRNQEIYDTDPDTGSAWTTTAFNAAEFGIEVD